MQVFGLCSPMPSTALAYQHPARHTPLRHQRLHLFAGGVFDDAFDQFLEDDPADCGAVFLARHKARDVFVAIK